ncbi:MAG: hypothetical protein ACRDPX_05185 [Gaiellaceae bacterium]
MSALRRRAREKEEFRVTAVASRLDQYEAPDVSVDGEGEAEPELVERAATLLAVMPRNQLRETIEDLLSPHDRERGRRAVDALIDRAFAIEDETGHLRRIA